MKSKVKWEQEAKKTWFFSSFWLELEEGKGRMFYFGKNDTHQVSFLVESELDSHTLCKK
jgi:hypothetical protein